MGRNSACLKACRASMLYGSVNRRVDSRVVGFCVISCKYYISTKPGNDRYSCNHQGRWWPSIRYRCNASNSGTILLIYESRLRISSHPPPALYFRPVPPHHQYALCIVLASFFDKWPQLAWKTEVTLLRANSPASRSTLYLKANQTASLNFGVVLLLTDAVIIMN